MLIDIDGMHIQRGQTEQQVELSQQPVNGASTHPEQLYLPNLARPGDTFLRPVADFATNLYCSFFR